MLELVIFLFKHKNYGWSLIKFCFFKDLLADTFL